MPRGLTEEQRVHRRRVIAEAGNLTDAAKLLGVGRATLGHWCKLHGVTYGSKVPRPAELPQAQARAAYEAEPSDRKAAARLGVDGEAFARWRRQAGLPAKGRSFADLLTDEQRHGRVAAYRASADLREFARRIGISTVAAADWLRRQGLPHPGEHRRRKELQRRFGQLRSWYFEAYQATDTDLEGATLMGVSLAEFRQWRSSEMLPPKASLGPPANPVLLRHDRRRSRRS